MKEDNIAILLSTYNGESYLKNQIDSIINQDFKNWNLFIRDDGSIDNTLEIVEEYCEKNKNINLIPDTSNKGAALSFMALLNYVEADYYMFCDQDDIWFNNKIDTVFKILKEVERGEQKPILVFSDAQVVDQNLNIMDSSFWSYNKVSPSLLLSQPEYISIFNCAPGCTMIFNNALKNHLSDYDKNIMMHDWFIMIKALQNGTVEFSDQALMMYRQHENNVIGASEISIKERAQKLTKIKKTLKLQIDTYNFVKKYMGISIFKFYNLKIKFNFLRHRKSF